MAGYHVAGSALLECGGLLGADGLGVSTAGAELAALRRMDGAGDLTLELDTLTLLLLTGLATGMAEKSAFV